MPRYSRPPLTLEDLWQSGYPVKVRDLMHATGWSRPNIIAAVDAGELRPIRMTHSQRACYYFERVEVQAWLSRCGFMPNRAGVPRGTS